MHNYKRTCAALLLAAATALTAADAPYMGKWKLDPAKSNFAGTTITYTDIGNGEMQFTAEGMSFKFKMDGQDYPDPFGGMVAFKQIGNNTWESTYKIKQKLVSTDTGQLSTDGKTLTVNSHGTKPNGESSNNTTVYTRVSGGPGIVGKWKTTKVNIGSPNVLELAPNGADGITLRIVDENAVCDAKFDGKDYPATGPTLPAGLSLAVEKNGARSFHLTTKMNGKELYKGTFTVSPDGKTLTGEGGAPATDEKTKSVYDRQ